jgi:hypothetical protein
MAPSVIHQDLAHELGRNCEKMRAALPLREILPNQSQISLMHERCTLQSVLGPLIPQMSVSQTAQFFIDQGQERVQGLAVAIPPALQKLRDLIRRPMRHRFA